MIITVQKGASAEIDAARSFTRRGDECSVAGQSPFRPHLRPVATAPKNSLIDVPSRRRAEQNRPLRTRESARFSEQSLEPLYFGAMALSRAIGVVYLDLICRGVVQGAEEMRVLWNDYSLDSQSSTHSRVVEDCRSDPRIGFSRM